MQFIQAGIFGDYPESLFAACEFEKMIAKKAKGVATLEKKGNAEKRKKELTTECQTFFSQHALKQEHRVITHEYGRVFFENIMTMDIRPRKRPALTIPNLDLLKKLAEEKHDECVKRYRIMRQQLGESDEISRIFKEIMQLLKESLDSLLSIHYAINSHQKKPLALIKSVLLYITQEFEKKFPKTEHDIDEALNLYYESLHDGGITTEKNGDIVTLFSKTTIPTSNDRLTALYYLLEKPINKKINLSDLLIYLMRFYPNPENPETEEAMRVDFNLVLNTTKCVLDDSSANLSDPTSETLSKLISSIRALSVYSYINSKGSLFKLNLSDQQSILTLEKAIDTLLNKFNTNITLPGQWINELRKFFSEYIRQSQIKKNIPSTDTAIFSEVLHSNKPIFFDPLTEAIAEKSTTPPLISESRNALDTLLKSIEEINLSKITPSNKSFKIKAAIHTALTALVSLFYEMHFGKSSLTDLHDKIISFILTDFIKTAFSLEIQSNETLNQVLTSFYHTLLSIGLPLTRSEKPAHCLLYPDNQMINPQFEPKADIFNETDPTNHEKYLLINLISLMRNHPNEKSAFNTFFLEFNRTLTAAIVHINDLRSKPAHHSTQPIPIKENLNFVLISLTRLCLIYAAAIRKRGIHNLCLTDYTKIKAIIHDLYTTLFPTDRLTITHSEANSGDSLTLFYNAIAQFGVHVAQGKENEINIRYAPESKDAQELPENRMPVTQQKKTKPLKEKKHKESLGCLLHTELLKNECYCLGENRLGFFPLVVNEKKYKVRLLINGPKHDLEISDDILTLKIPLTRQLGEKNPNFARRISDSLGEHLSTLDGMRKTILNFEPAILLPERCEICPVSVDPNQLKTQTPASMVASKINATSAHSLNEQQSSNLTEQRKPRTTEGKNDDFSSTQNAFLVFPTLTTSSIAPRKTSLSPEDLARKVVSFYQTSSLYEIQRLRLFISIFTQQHIPLYLKGFVGLDFAGIERSVLKHNDLDFVAFLKNEQYLELLQSMHSIAPSIGQPTKTYSFHNPLENYYSHTVNINYAGIPYDIQLVVGSNPKKYMRSPDHQTNFCSLTEISCALQDRLPFIQLGNTFRNLPTKDSNQNNATPETSQIYIDYLSHNPNRLTSAICHFLKCAMKTNTFEKTKPLLVFILSQISPADCNTAKQRLSEKLTADQYISVSQLFNLSPITGEGETKSSSITPPQKRGFSPLSPAFIPHSVLPPPLSLT
jgi:hypothetical protein